MPKQTARGNQFEIEVKKTLESLGWTVFRQHRKPMFIAGRMITVGADIFGCDLVAKKLGEKTKWVQVSTLAQKSKKEAQVLLFPWNLAYETVELWLRIDGKKEYRVFSLAPTTQGRYSVDGTVTYDFVEQTKVAVAK